jgi:hypothetical protein
MNLCLFYKALRNISDNKGQFRFAILKDRENLDGFDPVLV